jgi:hypothetical protein
LSVAASFLAFSSIASPHFRIFCAAFSMPSIAAPSS